MECCSPESLPLTTASSWSNCTIYYYYIVHHLMMKRSYLRCLVVPQIETWPFWGSMVIETSSKSQRSPLFQFLHPAWTRAALFSRTSGTAPGAQRLAIFKALRGRQISKSCPNWDNGCRGNCTWKRNDQHQSPESGNSGFVPRFRPQKAGMPTEKLHCWGLKSPSGAFVVLKGSCWNPCCTLARELHHGFHGLMTEMN